jgi:hypothetical protein
MAQHDYIISNATFPAVRTDINNALSAIQTTNSGTSRPTGAVSGQLWLDTTSATTPTLKYYDGADDISLATIDHTANTVNWLDSTVSITGLSTTATGTVLTLSDTTNTSTVNLIIDNQKEIRFRETTANGTNYVGLKAPASLSADLTYTLPSADGTSGQALVTNGSGVLSFTTISSGTSWQSVQTTGFTAVAGRGYPCNTTSAAFTVTLPASPSVGDYVQIVDYAGTFDTNALTISPNGNKIEGGTGNQLLTGDREGVTLVYIDSTQGWLASSGIQEGTDGLEPNVVSIDFLVVAGGGGCNGYDGGGGGGGGFRTSTQNVAIGTTITVTVGDGGAGVIDQAGAGNSGSNSSISGSGLTTITSAGGGGGGNIGASGASGGSGGGGGAGGSGGSGNTPSTSPSQGNNGSNGASRNGGGGGGAGASATNYNGGNGSASSITGSSVTYAGGGGGGATTSAPAGTAGSGGTGGGGAGATGYTGVQIAGTSGTTNLGGGGGGGSDYTTSATTNASGGKGVVILSVPTAKYSSTSTGSPTVTTSGSNTILKFNGSGSYTA